MIKLKPSEIGLIAIAGAGLLYLRSRSVPITPNQAAAGVSPASAGSGAAQALADAFQQGQAALTNLITGGSGSGAATQSTLIPSGSSWYKNPDGTYNLQGAALLDASGNPYYYGDPGQINEQEAAITADLKSGALHAGESGAWNGSAWVYTTNPPATPTTPLAKLSTTKAKL